MSYKSKTLDGFLIGGRNVGAWVTAFSYGTTYFSAVVFVGYAGQHGWNIGIGSVWIGIGNAVIGTLIAWLVLAKRTKNMTRRLEAKTMPEFFEKRYGSKNLKLVTAVIIFVFLIPYSASVYNGLSTLFEIVFGIDGRIVMIALAALTALYLFFGGYFATALSDFIQGIIMIIGVVCMYRDFFCEIGELLGKSTASILKQDISKLVNDPNLTWFTFDADSKGIYGSTVSLIALILLTSLGVWALPQTVHKYYAIRDKKAITQGIVISTAFALIIGFIAYFTGALSIFFSETVGVAHAQVIPTMLSIVIPAGLTGLIAVLILSASMSTLSSVSLAGASVIAVDLYKGAVNKTANDKRVNTVMRLFCLLFVVISVVLAILNEAFGIAAIAYMMGVSWGTLAGCFMGPYVLGVLWKKVTKPAVWASVVSSIVLTAVLIVVFGFDKNGWSCSLGVALKDGVATSPLIGVICMLFSLVITVLVSLLTKKPDGAILYEAFDKPCEGEIK